MEIVTLPKLFAAAGFALAFGFILAVTLCGGCAREPTAIEKAYDARLAEAAADCIAKGGDEFKPYGSVAWTVLISGRGKPMVWRCQRLEKNWKRGIAVYAFRVDGERIAMETR